MALSESAGDAVKMGERVLARTIAVFLARRRLYNAEEALRADNAGHPFTADTLRARAGEDAELLRIFRQHGLWSENDLTDALGDYAGRTPPELAV